MWRQDATVYVIEGDPNVLTGLNEFLAAQGFDSQRFTCPRAFLSALDPARPGALIVDIHMQGMSMVDLKSTIAECGAALPLLVMAALADLRDAIEALKAGVFEFVEKPIRTTELMQSLYLAFDASRTIQPTVQLVARLTARERQVFDLLVAGHTNKVIADLLDVTDKTVEAHRSKIMNKLEAGSLATLIQISEQMKRGSL